MFSSLRLPCGNLKVWFLAFVLAQFAILVRWHLIDLCASSQHVTAASLSDFDEGQDATKRPNLQQSSYFESLRNDFGDPNRFARVFPRWNRSFPCFPAEPDWNLVSTLRRPTSKGFLYFKARKAASSTTAGVALRIARNVAARMQTKNAATPTTSNTTTTTTQHCHTRFGHPPAWYLRYSKRDRHNSFLWTIIREPTQRHISEFFHFQVSRLKVEPTDDNFMQYLFATNMDPIGLDNYYLRYMKTDRRFRDGRDNHASVVRHILHEYDFIGISERMEESLVALQMILGLETSDVLYLRSKVHGGFDDGQENRRCYYIVPSFVSPGMKEFFETAERWYNFTRGDALLHQAVHASLDRTILALGRTEFDKKLSILRWALSEANDACVNVTFPCSPGGRLNAETDCLQWDCGCGYQCLDQVGIRLGV